MEKTARFLALAALVAALAGAWATPRPLGDLYLALSAGRRQGMRDEAVGAPCAVEEHGLLRALAARGGLKRIAGVIRVLGAGLEVDLPGGAPGALEPDLPPRLVLLPIGRGARPRLDAGPPPQEDHLARHGLRPRARASAQRDAPIRSRRSSQVTPRVIQSGAGSPFR